MSETFENLCRIIRNEFPKFRGDITPETVADDVDGWDSIGHTNLIFRIEKEFGKAIDDEAIYEFENVGAIATYLDAH